MGQIEKFLHTRAKTKAQPLATAKRDQRLHELKTRIIGISEWVEKAHHSLKAVGSNHDQHGHCTNRYRNSTADITQWGACQKHHAQGNHHDHCRATKIRLQQQQHTQHSDNKSRFDNADSKGRHRRGIADKMICEIQYA